MEPLKLTPSIVSQTDLARLTRELNSLEDFFVSATNRQSGVSMKLPKLTRMMDDLCRENNVNLLDQDHRTQLGVRLKNLYDHAPRVHASFAVEPNPRALEKILVWLRSNVHPQTLINTGIQPNIAAGCKLRTANKVFDMSLRANLEKQSQYLAQLLQGAVSGS